MADYTIKGIDALPPVSEGSAIGTLATNVLAFFTENPEAKVAETSAQRMGRKARAALAEHGLEAGNRNGRVYVWRVTS